jgi:hypothetical protein
MTKPEIVKKIGTPIHPIEATPRRSGKRVWPSRSIIASLEGMIQDVQARWNSMTAEAARNRRRSIPRTCVFLPVPGDSEVCSVMRWQPVEERSGPTGGRCPVHPRTIVRRMQEACAR